MIYLNTSDLKEKISALENKYAELFERNASVEKLNALWQQIRDLKSLQSNDE